MPPISSPATPATPHRMPPTNGLPAVGVDFVALDVETANGFRGSLCQIGMARVKDGRIVGTWGTLLRPPPGRDLFDPDNVAVHGIRPEDVAEAPAVSAAWPQVLGRLAGHHVVAHNAGFDSSALHAAATVCGLECPDVHVACSLVLARKRYQLDSYTLDTCCSAAGITLERHHDAVADALGAAGLVIDMARRLGAEDLDHLLEASGVAWGHLGPDGYTSCRSVARDEGIALPRLF